MARKAYQWEEWLVADKESKPLGPLGPLGPQEGLVKRLRFPEALLLADLV